MTHVTAPVITVCHFILPKNSCLLGRLIGTPLGPVTSSAWSPFSVSVIVNSTFWPFLKLHHLWWGFFVTEKKVSCIVLSPSQLWTRWLPPCTNYCWLQLIMRSPIALHTRKAFWENLSDLQELVIKPWPQDVNNARLISYSLSLLWKRFTMRATGPRDIAITIQCKYAEFWWGIINDWVTVATLVSNEIP